MASTYYYQDVAIVVGQAHRRDLTDNIGADIANIAHNYIWNRADWRESQAELPPFWLNPGEQDHGPPEAIVPADFLGLREAYITDITSGPDNRRSLVVQSGLGLTNVEDWPANIQYKPSTKAFRLFPRVPTSFGPTRFMIEGTYKKRPTKITAQNMTSTLIPWDDSYYHVFIAAFTWALFVSSGDQRAGQVVTDGRGRKQTTGQLGVLEVLLNKMIDDEGINLGDPGISPRDGLALGGTVFSSGNVLGW